MTQYKISSIFVSCIALLFTTFSVFAEEEKTSETEKKGDLYFSENAMRLSPENPIINKKIRIYFRVENTSQADMKGVVRAYDITESRRISTEQSFTTIQGKAADIYWDFTPKAAGVHEITFRIIPWENYSENSIENDKITKKIFVDNDLDGDGVGDQVDPDDDNDGVNDNDDLFPLNGKEWADSDGDGTGDNADLDDDNDGILDVDDEFPNDSSEGKDTDKDGKGDNTDEDDDNDGIVDEREILNGTNPLIADTDGDGVDDGADDYPLDSNFQKDTDRDGIPNKEDNDDDGDGVKDYEDIFPEDKNEWQDFDGDGVGNIADTDDDNDGLEDEKELEIGSNPRLADSDGDGVIDGEDALPLDKNETLDSDGDGIGDNSDENNNNKGPVIQISKSAPFIVGRKEIFTISAENSKDPEGGELSFLWEIIDENGKISELSQSPILNIKSPSTGEFILRLTVKDEAGESRMKNLPLTIIWSQWDKYATLTGGLLIFFIIVFIFAIWRRKK